MCDGWLVSFWCSYIPTDDSLCSWSTMDATDIYAGGSLSTDGMNTYRDLEMSEELLMIRKYGWLDCTWLEKGYFLYTAYLLL